MLSGLYANTKGYGGTGNPPERDISIPLESLAVINISSLLLKATLNSDNVIVGATLISDAIYHAYNAKIPEALN